MEIIKSLKEMHYLSDTLRTEGKTIVCVPTMGYFHEGHLNLMKRASELGDIVVTTLFVNPTQFGPNEDFDKYPRDIERDIKLASAAGVNYLFLPETSEIYPNGSNTYVQVGRVSEKFEGLTRQNHFKGVATVVVKLFNAIKPHYAVFGQKDYQQTLVVKQLTSDLLFDLRIVVSPTTREDDGLAMSSRNVYLNESEREQATILFKALEEATNHILNGETKRKTINAIMHNTLRSVSGIRIDYASSATADTLDEPDEFKSGDKIVLLIAVYIGRTRLIDNAIVTII